MLKRRGPKTEPWETLCLVFLLVTGTGSSPNLLLPITKIAAKKPQGTVQKFEAG